MGSSIRGNNWEFPTQVKIVASLYDMGQSQGQDWCGGISGNCPVRMGDVAVGSSCSGP